MVTFKKVLFVIVASLQMLMYAVLIVMLFHYHHFVFEEDLIHYYDIVSLISSLILECFLIVEIIKSNWITKIEKRNLRLFAICFLISGCFVISGLVLAISGLSFYIEFWNNLILEITIMLATLAFLGYYLQKLIVSTHQRHGRGTE